MFYQHIYDCDDGQVGGREKLCFDDDVIKQRSLTFQPFVVEELGAVHTEAMDIFNRLCEFISIRQNKPLTQIKFKYSKLLSSAIQRQNSRAILSRFC